MGLIHRQIVTTRGGRRATHPSFRPPPDPKLRSQPQRLRTSISPPTSSSFSPSRASTRRHKLLHSSARERHAPSSQSPVILPPVPSVSPASPLSSVVNSHRAWDPRAAFPVSGYCSSLLFQLSVFSQHFLCFSVTIQGDILSYFD